MVPGCPHHVREGFAMPVYALGDHVPEIHPEAYVHPDATVIGQVSVGAGSTVWPGAVLRGDYGRIFVGERTSIQDGTVVHATEELATKIGSDCVVGHIAHLEGCEVEDGCLIGSGSVLLHRVVVRSGALVGAGAVVSPGTEVPSGAMALGVPAKIRTGAVQPGSFEDAVARYVANGQRYARELRRID
jgi:carbonic anhydrase/acetyltransferase-like protein (isoleucine patch superfamily)